MRARVAVAVALFAVEDGDLKVGLRKERRGRSLVLSLPMRFAEHADELEALAKTLAESVVANEITLMQQTGAHLVEDEESSAPVLVVGYRAICSGATIIVPGRDLDFAFVHELRKRESVRFVRPHADILDISVRWLTSVLEHSLVAADFCGRTFTISDLRRVYDAIWETKLDPSNFHRKVTNPALRLVRKVKEPSGKGPRRVAALYERGSGGLLYPPLRRPPAKQRKRRRHRSVWAISVADPAAFVGKKQKRTGHWSE